MGEEYISDHHVWCNCHQKKDTSSEVAAYLGVINNVYVPRIEELVAANDQLATENARLREQVINFQKWLKDGVYYTTNEHIQFMKRQDVLRDGMIDKARQDTARECLKWMIQSCCISEKQANNFCGKFGLEV